MAEDGVRIYDRDKSWAQTAAGVTAPTAELYNLFDAGRTATKSMFLEDSSPIETALYVLSEVVSTRDGRSFLESRLKAKIMEEED